MPGKVKMDDTHRVEVDSGTRKEIFHVDKRYTQLKSVSEGSHGFVAAAQDTLKVGVVRPGVGSGVVRSADHRRRHDHLHHLHYLQHLCHHHHHHHHHHRHHQDRGVAIKKVTNFLRDLDDAKRIAREIKLLMHLSSHQVR